MLDKLHHKTIHLLIKNNTNMRSFILLGLISISLFACKQEPKTNFKSLNLLAQGVPVTIMAPENPEIKTMDMLVSKDITVKKDPDFNVQIYASEAHVSDVSKIKSEHLTEVKDNPYFSKIISDEADGFIYEKQLDSTLTSYGFRYVLVQGDKEYIFQNGFIGIYSLQQIQNMYDAVKQKKK